MSLEQWIDYVDRCHEDGTEIMGKEEWEREMTN